MCIRDRCTDARVNLVTPALFESYPTLDAFCEADREDVEKLIHSCGFYPVSYTHLKLEFITAFAIKSRKTALQRFVPELYASPANNPATAFSRPRPRGAFAF